MRRFGEQNPKWGSREAGHGHQQSAQLKREPHLESAGILRDVTPLRYKRTAERGRIKKLRIAESMKKAELAAEVQKLIDENGGGLIPVVNALHEALFLNHPVTRGQAQACAGQVTLHGQVWVNEQEEASWEEGL